MKEKLRYMALAAAFLSLFPATSFAAAASGETAASATQASTATTQAAEATTQELAKQELFFSVSSDVALTETDIFKATLLTSDGREESIEINAKNAGNMAYQVTEGEYTVTALEYKGTDQAISSSGYGITKSISVTGDGISHAALCIGANQISLAEAGTLFTAGGTSTGDNGSSTGTTEATSGETAAEAPTGAATTQEGAASTAESTLEDPDEKKVVEEVKQESTEEEEEDSGYVAFKPQKLIFVLILAVFGGGYLYFKWKKVNG